jgi:hypothetical protein
MNLLIIIGLVLLPFIAAIIVTFVVIVVNLVYLAWSSQSWRSIADRMNRDRRLLAAMLSRQPNEPEKKPSRLGCCLRWLLYAGIALLIPWERIFHSIFR